jgi:hypothetical protein
MFMHLDLESRIPKSRPISKIRRIVGIALEDFESSFKEMYDSLGRLPIPPEQTQPRVQLLHILAISVQNTN